jgi:threonyl-tRNA synthetase
MWKERFFYFVLKWEFNYIDNSGKASALSTDQIDVENGSRYGIEFVDESNTPKNPIILHNSPSGAIERVMYTLLEKAATDAKEGRKPQLPLWLAPTQVRIIPVKNEFLESCKCLAETWNEQNIRTDIDDRNDSVGKRIRDAEKEWIPYILVIGEEEQNQADPSFTVRVRKTNEEKSMAAWQIVEDIQSQTQGKPHSSLNAPLLLSKRPVIQV